MPSVALEPPLICRKSRKGWPVGEARRGINRLRTRACAQVIGFTDGLPGRAERLRSRSGTDSPYRPTPNEAASQTSGSPTAFFPHRGNMTQQDARHRDAGALIEDLLCCIA